MHGPIDTAFTAAIEAAKINGAIICATNRNRDFTYEQSFGERTLLSGEKVPERLDDICYLASATKLLTNIAALQCIEDGLLSLNGDLSSVAPKLSAKDILTGFSHDGGPQLEPQRRRIDLEMLLTHSSGLVYYFENSNIARWRELTRGLSHGRADATAKQAVEELFDYPLTFQPGSSWMYGCGIDWAGRIVERVTSKTLGARMHERLFQPLGICDASFYPVTRDDLRARMIDVNPCDPEGLGKAVLGGAEFNTPTKGDFGGHGLFMTAPDYLRVLHSLLANDGKHLSPEAATAQRAATESVPAFRPVLAVGSEVGCGLGGLVTLQDVEGWCGERTMTWQGGHTFTWFIDRKNDLCGVRAVQASMPLDTDVVGGLKDAFRHDIYRKHVAWNKERV